ncbi:recombinase family protein [Amycolatopsis sp. cmx-11-12]|uniref:recombinase family protein n=1 Tax=Amycolatopsis sp. cmx-11-12 TaxID=2785795 RepID=UPI0039184246
MTGRFAFYGRVSTEDQQDPEASRNWQLARSRALIERHGEVVTSFFDIGQSRSIPWKRRPQASLLLEALKDRGRGFDGVVIGEPQRAFYGNQYGLTFPVFMHYGVQLWVPEVGGPIDPESEAHDLVMSVFGGMSKGERTRIKVRVRTAMAAQAQVEGRYLGGRPPYGYQLVDVGPHPNPAKAADGKRLRRLEADPTTGPTVQRIFQEYLSGIGVFAIAQRLTDDGIACPSFYDRARNPHRSGVAWSKSAVRGILGNPRYTGHEVWNKQRKQESLIDVEDVALGHETKMAWNPKDQWILSDQPVHDPLVSSEVFEQVQLRLAARGPRSTGRVTARRQHGYALKGLLFHDTCGRRMQGNWNHNMAHYRCRFPNEYAIANKIDHPLTVYVRENAILDQLDRWLAEVFRPERVEQSLTMLEAAQPDIEPAHAEIRRALLECDRKLGRHRAALEAGADPALVAAWSGEVQREQAALKARLAADSDGSVRCRRMSGEEIQALVEALGGLLATLREADPADKLEVYRQLGVKLTYDHEKRVVTAETQPKPPVCAVNVSEGRAAH